MSIRNLRSYFRYLTGGAKYLFIHIPKNAGVTIRHSEELRGRIVPVEKYFLTDLDYTRRLLETMRASGDHHGIGHARLRDVSPRVRANLQAFAIVRNPWARVVSRYTFAQKAMQSGSAISSYAPRSFEEFVEERHVWGGREFFWHRAIRGWFPQVDYITDEAGGRPVHVLRSEFLDEEARKYFSLDLPVGRRNVSNAKTDYRSFYTPETVQKVADWYASDIEAFGFDFDTAATRNYYYEND